MLTPCKNSLYVFAVELEERPRKKPTKPASGNRPLEFLPRDARSAKRGVAIASRPSVRLSVRLSICNV